MITALVSLAALFSVLTAASAERPPEVAPDVQPAGDSWREETILVVGRGDEAAAGIPGAVSVVSQEELELRRPGSVQDAVRGLTGVNLRTDSPFGVTPNIGIRGLNPDRSEKLLMLEDGLPAGLAPYNENASYFTPPVQRMERLELLKGSGSILHGPQTVGGVLNFVTPTPPAEPAGRITTQYGSDAHALLHVQHGGTRGRVGWSVSGLRSQGDGYRDGSKFELTDLAAKLVIKLTDLSSLTWRSSWQDADSHLTYQGLTTPMFAANPRQYPAKDDLLHVEWYSSSVTYKRAWAAGAELSVSLYHADASRFWNRQDYSRNSNFAPAPSNTVLTVGDTSVAGGAIYERASFGSRDRSFDYWGIEPRILIERGAGAVKHRTWAGTRWHVEDMTDARNNRDTLASTKRTRTEELRQVDALAIFVQHEVRVRDKVSIVPGIRFESYSQQRTFYTNDYVPDPSDGKTTTSELIPGLGLSWDVNARNELFFGVHRGFAPPRTSQAVDPDGVDLQLDAEKSWNWELGLRTQPMEGLSLDAAVFMLDFQNQVVPANASGGASTRETNAGQTRHVGLELGGALDLFNVGRRSRPGRLELGAAITFQDTENVTPNGVNRGKELPYAPHVMARISLDWRHARGFEVGGDWFTTSSQYADQAQTVAPTADGMNGRIPAYRLVNLRARITLREGTTDVFFNVNNLFDAEYIASRAPEGIFPGAFRQLVAGATWRF